MINAFIFLKLPEPVVQFISVVNMSCLYMNLNVIDRYPNTTMPLDKRMKKGKREEWPLRSSRSMEGIKEDIVRFKNYVEVAKRDGLDTPELGYFVV